MVFLDGFVVAMVIYYATNNECSLLSKTLCFNYMVTWHCLYHIMSVSPMFCVSHSDVFSKAHDVFEMRR